MTCGVLFQMCKCMIFILVRKIDIHQKTSSMERVTFQKWSPESDLYIRSKKSLNRSITSTWIDSQSCKEFTFYIWGPGKARCTFLQWWCNSYCRWRSFTNGRLSTTSIWRIYIKEKYIYNFRQSNKFSWFSKLQKNIWQQPLHYLFKK